VRRRRGKTHALKVHAARVLFDDEEGGAGFGGDAVRGAGFVGDVIAHAGVEGEFGAVLMLDDDLAGDDEHDVAFVAPVAGDVVAAEIDETELDVAEFADARGGGAGFAEKRGGWEFGPVDGGSRQIFELHGHPPGDSWLVNV
jgi:hypothetical protein